MYIDTQMDNEEEQAEEDHTAYLSDHTEGQSGNTEVGETVLGQIKRSLDDTDDNDAWTTDLQPALKLRKIKIEPEDYVEQSDALVDPLELASDVKEEEEEEEYETEEEIEDGEDEIVDVGEAYFASPPQEPQEPGPSLKIKKCAKCAIVFSLIPNNVPASLPSALQKFCPKCKPNVSITCKYCGKHFEHHKLYSRHVRACGSGAPERLKCKHCQDCFLSDQQLKTHKCTWTESIRLLRFVCPICCEGFEKNKERINHKNLHVKPRPIKCTACNVIHSEVRSFQEHMDLHLVRRHFICTTCCMSFETRALFDADQRKHLKNKEKTEDMTHVPDFVYVCKSCKHWYPTLYGFGHHECKNDVSIQDPLSLTNVVLRALDFGGETSKPATLGFKVAGGLLSSDTMKQNPPQEMDKDDSENSGAMLSSSFKCQLCKDIFNTASALGYHSCLAVNSAYDFQDDSDSEDEGHLSDGEKQ